MFSREIK